VRGDRQSGASRCFCIRSVDGVHQDSVEVIEILVKRKAPCSTGEIGAKARSSHPFERGVQRVAGDPRHKRMQIEVSLGECGRFSGKDGSLPFLQHQVQLKPLSVCPPPRGGTSGHLRGDRRPQRMQFGSVRSTMRHAQDGSESRPLTYEDPNSVSDLDHAEVRQGGERFPQHRQTDLELECQLP
jgi:hypothetical protein